MPTFLNPLQKLRDLYGDYGVDFSGAPEPPTAPVGPKLPVPPQIPTPAVPRDVSDIEDKLTFNPSAHLTLPAEASALDDTRAKANTYQAMAGLRSNQPTFPGAPPERREFFGRQIVGPSRNQAQVDRMRLELGMQPEAPGDASISQADLEAEFKPHEAFAHMIEQMKAQGPAAAAQASAAGQLAVERERSAGQQRREEAGYQQLKDLIDSGQVEPGAYVSTPGGFSFKTATPAQMIAPGTGKAAGDVLNKLKKELADLPAPGSFSGGFRELELKARTGKTLEQHRQDLQQQISDLERQLQIPNVSGPQVQPSRAPVNQPAAPQAPPGWRYVAKPGGGWTAVPEGQ